MPSLWRRSLTGPSPTPSLTNLSDDIEAYVRAAFSLDCRHRSSIELCGRINLLLMLADDAIGRNRIDEMSGERILVDRPVACEWTDGRRIDAVKGIGTGGDHRCLLIMVAAAMAYRRAARGRTAVHSGTRTSMKSASSLPGVLRVHAADHVRVAHARHRTGSRHRVCGFSFGAEPDMRNPGLRKPDRPAD